MKKRTIIVAALAVVLALSFATIATAKYAGWGSNAGSTTPGYLSWTGAQQIWGTDATAQSLRGTAHGGYVSTTVKCAVCHSAHRAVTAEVSAGTVNTDPNGSQNNMLAMGNSCTACHTTWGSGNATKKVEWGDTNVGRAAGPHTGRGSCSACHTGGIHGGNSSNYHGMNVYLIGATSDSVVADAFDRGNTMNNTAAQTWFESGSTSAISSGAVPSGLAAPGFAQAKATATGYTCAVTNCHLNSQFAVNKWGFASSITQASDVTTATTGHASAPGSNSAHAARINCSPCHPGNGAGGYRTTAASATFAANAYGCDQCHDMVGVATNTTAWPHGNRGIDVYEWDKDNTQSTVVNQGSGNLWMYQFSIVSTQTTGGYTPIDQSFKVVKGAVGPANPDGTSPYPGNINDGVCLKCHVAIDQASTTAVGAASTTAVRAYHAQPSPLPTVLPTNPLSTSFIYLWR